MENKQGELNEWMNQVINNTSNSNNNNNDDSHGHRYHQHQL